MLTRRRFLGTSALTAVTLGLAPKLARASTGSDRKFIFVFAQGGWDPTRVFASEFANPNVDMEYGVVATKAGGITYVDTPTRPSVRTFMDAWHSRSIIFNGVMVRSIAHEICTMIAMTGTTSGQAPDWPAIMASAQRDSFTLPQLVLGGPSYTGDFGVAVARTGNNGQLDALLSGDALTWTDSPLVGPNLADATAVDRWLAKRAAARLATSTTAAEKALLADFATATAHAADLKDLRTSMSFASGEDLADQVPVGVAALSLGISRCVMMSSGHSGAWDTHDNNDNEQGPLWESMFAGLNQLMDALSTTIGPSGLPLSEETTVVVLSEMGRTPQLNTVQGKDHWPFTSLMFVGPGMVGDRVIGGYDDNYYGKLINPATGELDPKGSVLSAESIGATLLTMADLDPEEFVTGVDPLAGIIE